jgi:hypothetical protein
MLAGFLSAMRSLESEKTRPVLQMNLRFSKDGAPRALSATARHFAWRAILKLADNTERVCIQACHYGES